MTAQHACAKLFQVVALLSLSFGSHGLPPVVGSLACLVHCRSATSGTARNPTLASVSKGLFHAVPKLGTVPHIMALAATLSANHLASGKSK